MTNYEFIKSIHNGSNATHLGEYAFEMFKKRLGTRTNVIGGNNSTTFERWMYEEADTALVFNIGQFVTFEYSGKKTYGIVAGFWQSSVGGCPITRVYIKSSKGLVERCDSEVSCSDIPSDIIDLVKSQMKEDRECSDSLKEKCPFRNEYKDPVPPCMKDGELD